MGINGETLRMDKHDEYKAIEDTLLTSRGRGAGELESPSVAKRWHECERIHQKHTWHKITNPVIPDIKEH